MSDTLVLDYDLPAVRWSGNRLQDVERQNDAFRSQAIALCERLNLHGVEDGYEISMKGLETMQVLAHTVEAAFILRCLGGYRTKLGEQTA